MTHLHLSRWNGQFSSPSVIATIRRKISGALAGGECVVVYDGDAKGLTEATRKEIRRDWPPNKVQFSNAHPTLAVPPTKKPKRRRRGILGKEKPEKGES
jgi:hypothetical protein